MSQDVGSLDIHLFCLQRSNNDIVENPEPSKKTRHIPVTSYHDELTEPFKPHDPATWDHATVYRTKKSWASMKGRIRPSFHCSERYSERGIDADPRWVSDFYIFASEVGPRPVGMTLDRIDGDKGYWPGNCRWATQEVQHANRSSHSTRKQAAVSIALTKKSAATTDADVISLMDGAFHEMRCLCGRVCVVGAVSARHRPFRCSLCRGEWARFVIPAQGNATPGD